MFEVDEEKFQKCIRDILANLDTEMDSCLEKSIRLQTLEIAWDIVSDSLKRIGYKTTDFY